MSWSPCHGPLLSLWKLAGASFSFPDFGVLVCWVVVTTLTQDLTQFSAGPFLQGLKWFAIRRRATSDWFSMLVHTVSAQERTVIPKSSQTDRQTDTSPMVFLKDQSPDLFPVTIFFSHFS